MHKDIIDKQKLESVKTAGMAEVAGVVKTTLGPGGRPIMIQRVGQALDGSPIGPKITKDGVSVAEECSSKDPEKDIIIQSVKSICKKTNTDAGDGTTTAIVLGEAILNEMDNALSQNRDLNPQIVKEEVESLSKRLIQELKDSAQEIKDTQKIEQVATISANGDVEVGKIIAEAFDKVGAEGVVTVDEGRTNGVTLDHVDGYQFNRGAESRNNFFNDKAQTKYEAKDAAVIIYDGPLQNYTQLIPVLNLLAGFDGQQATKKIPPIVLIANEFTSEVLQFLLIQKMEAGMQIVPVRGPHTTTVRTAYYEDLAVYTGGSRMGNGQRSLDEITEDDIGEVGRVVIDKYKTTLYDGMGHEDTLIDRVDVLNEQKIKAESAYDAQVINDRIAALTSGVAKIGVGGATEFEIKEKYDRIEDALNAARAGIQEGVVPGGGCTLLRLAASLEDDQDIASQILSKALRYPFYQILENIGIKRTDAEEMAQQVISSDNENLVFDARNRTLTDALESGIIDPVKVTRTGLENAISIATLLSTAGGAIIYRADK
jgi:chaperonin GroEL